MNASISLESGALSEIFYMFFVDNEVVIYLYSEVQLQTTNYLIYLLGPSGTHIVLIACCVVLTLLLATGTRTQNFIRMK